MLSNGDGLGSCLHARSASAWLRGPALRLSDTLCDMEITLEAWEMYTVLYGLLGVLVFKAHLRMQATV